MSDTIKEMEVNVVGTDDEYSIEREIMDAVYSNGQSRVQAFINRKTMFYPGWYEKKLTNFEGRLYVSRICRYGERERERERASKFQKKAYCIFNIPKQKTSNWDTIPNDKNGIQSRRSRVVTFFFFNRTTTSLTFLETG